MDWFRWYHGSVEDGKFRQAQRYASGRCDESISLSDIIATWALILEGASQNGNRGSLKFQEDYIASVLDYSDEKIDAIFKAFVNIKLICLDEFGGRVNNWCKRQRECDADPTNAERQKRHREKQHNNAQLSKDNELVTERNAVTVTDSNAPDTDTEVEKTLKPLPEKNTPASGSVSNPKKQKLGSGDPCHSWFTAWFSWSFLQTTGEKYAYSAADAGIISQLLKTLSIEKLVERSCAYLLTPDDLRFPRGSPDTRGLRYQINKVAASFTPEIEQQAMQYRLLPPPEIPLDKFRPWEET